MKELQERKDRGELYHDPNAPEGPPLGDDFWANAVVVEPRVEKKSVHLKLDKDVFEFFEQGGRGHLTRMQNVLRSYMLTKKKASSDAA